MLGIPDPWVWMAYLLCILSTVGCILWGWLFWNKGDQPVQPGDVQWTQQEKKTEQEL